MRRSPLFRHSTATGLSAGMVGVMLFTACGGGSKSTPPPPLSLRSAGTVSLPLAVYNSSANYYETPYSGTTTITITRDATVSGNVQLTVSGLPAHVAASFAQANTAGNSDELSIQAGIPSSDFKTELYPTAGTYPITVTATATATSTSSTPITSSTTFNLVLAAEKPVLGLNFLDPSGQSVVLPTVLSMSSTAGLQQKLAVYQANATPFSASTQVSLNAVGMPAGLTVSFSNAASGVTVASFTPQASLSPGIYSFAITASAAGSTQSLPVVIAYSPYPFFIQPPFQTSTPPAVAVGGSTSFPLYLGHQDPAFFGTSEELDASGNDPLYSGTTQLIASGAPSGMTVSFGANNAQSAPTALAYAPLNIQVNGSVAPGTYPITLQATRSGGATPQASQLYTQNIRVTSPQASAPTVWIQGVEWGQTILEPNLPLVSGKAALLAVQLMADRPNQSSPVLTARLQDGSSYTLQGPATIPTAVTEGSLSTSGTPSSNPSIYSVLIPAAEVKTGMSVTLGASTSIIPATPIPVTVLPGSPMNLTLVPIVHGGTQPVLPSTADITNEVAAIWPVQSVNLNQRATYTTTTVIPLSTGVSGTSTEIGNAWGQLLGELAGLKMVDGSSNYYYGCFNLNLPAHYTGLAIVGLSELGQGVSLGLDDKCAAEFQNDDAPLDNSVMIMTHELGHALNLNHAPAGGAGSPQLNYPYNGAAIGSWGFNPLTQTLVDPTIQDSNPADTTPYAAGFHDIMSYSNSLHFVSDWNYLAALGWLQGLQPSPSGIADVSGLQGVFDRWVVSGWISPDGSAHLSPILRSSCGATPAQPGAYQLVIHSTQGDVSVPFAPTQVPDLPQGFRHFSFAVPAAGEVNGVEIQLAGQAILKNTASQVLAQHEQRVDADTLAGALVAQEQDGHLHLEWNAAHHLYVTVVHEGSCRTTLGMHLKGGKADLPLEGLEEGGHFLIHYSDGLNQATRVLER